MKISRRNFLQGLCGAGMLVAIGAWADESDSHAAFIRPPGGQDISQLQALCLKCNKCVEACPTKAIEVAHLESGFLEARMPIMNFHLGFCTFCGDCIKACPSGALTSTDLKKTHIGVAHVIEKNCVAWDWGGCTVCKTACKYDAITIDKNQRPIVNASKCNGCGKCEYMCPAAKVRSFKVGHGKGIVIIPNDTRRQKGAIA